MPEGDTIFRAAYTLRKALLGKEVTGFRSPLPALREPELVGRHVTEVEARGKNLLIRFDDGRALYSHMRMEGSWHIYRPGERWQKPESRARAVLETADIIAVCFSAPVVELLTDREVDRHPTISKLGPDLLGTEFNWEEALTRLRTRNAAPIGEAVMRQDTMAGIGNVYKSEVLFLLKINPFIPVSELSDQQLKEIAFKARELMKQNLTGAKRTTRHALDGQRLWIYGRSGQPCRRCSTKVQMRRQGLEGRSTYWCPECQKVRPHQSSTPTGPPVETSE